MWAGGVVVAVLVGMVVFVGLFFGLQAIFNASSSVAAGIAAILTGLLFNPLRHTLQHRLGREVPEYRNGHKVGAFHLTEVIGSGSMGTVWRGQHESTGRAAAIKIIPTQSGNHAGIRFEREIRIVAALHHPHIIALYDVGQTGGSSYMVMEYIDGESLAALLRQGLLPLETTLRIIGQIAAALDYIHAQGIVHRDVKPSNIMIRRTGEAVLMDFGIVKLLGDDELTKANGIVGTLYYMPPEQIAGTLPIDGRADIYALGVMAYEMLTEQLPFTGDNPGVVLMGHLQHPIPDPRSIRPGLPASVTPAFRRALAKKPEDRFAHASAFAAALDPRSQPAPEIGKISDRLE